MSVFVIPVINVPQQVEIALAGVNYSLTCKWNDADEGGWALDIADAVTGQVLVAYLPLITGANLLDGLEYLGIGGTLYVQTDGDVNAVPTLENLGVESFLYFITDDTTDVAA